MLEWLVGVGGRCSRPMTLLPPQDADDPEILGKPPGRGFGPNVGHLGAVFTCRTVASRRPCPRKSGRSGIRICELKEFLGLARRVRDRPGGRRVAVPRLASPSPVQSRSPACYAERVGIGSRRFGDLGGRRDARAHPVAQHGLAGRGVPRLCRLHGHAAVRRGAGRASADAERARTAILCSEAVPWRCHRRLDRRRAERLGRGRPRHYGPRPVEPHALTDFAWVRDRPADVPRRAATPRRLRPTPRSGPGRTTAAETNTRRIGHWTCPNVSPPDRLGARTTA